MSRVKQTLKVRDTESNPKRLILLGVEYADMVRPVEGTVESLQSHVQKLRAESVHSLTYPFNPVRIFLPMREKREHRFLETIELN